jgi:hypothetical protein
MISYELPPNPLYYAYVVNDGGIVELNTCTL